jgi:hypothetical protein
VTGPDHYQEAERLVGPRTVTSIPSGETRQGPPTTDMILQAQVHATLALAAATAMDASHMDDLDYIAWDIACGVSDD